MKILEPKITYSTIQNKPPKCNGFFKIIYDFLKCMNITYYKERAE